MLICNRCNRVIIPEWETYIPHREGVMHSYHFARREIRWLFFVALFFLFSIIAAVTAKSDHIYDEKNWKKGGIVTGITNSGKCIMKPFVQTGTTEDHPDTNEPQILGYSPGSVQLDRKGKIIWERTSERQFVRLGKAKMVNGRFCRCHPYNE